MSEVTKVATEKVSYIVFEGEMTRMERTNHRLWILCILLLIVLVSTNAGWLYYESSFEDIVLTQEAQADNGSDIKLIGGDEYVGESETDN